MANHSWRRTPSVGGKIVKNRKQPQPTPYARPSASTSNDPSGNPNWLSGLFYPAKFIASGVLSFFGDDDDVQSTSSSENAYDDDEIENDMSYLENDRPYDKVLLPSSKSDNKHAIEQLVMQETYSRKEANELINLIKSRTVEFSGSIGDANPNLCTTAIMEARKWLQERRLGSNKKLENELDVSSMASPSKVDARNEKGSPVDVARSYMQSRPTWASPSSKKFDGSSSPFGVLHFKEETPKSTLQGSELKKSSFTSGSWSLQDEIRRVRSKATEELLAAAPLTKNILSSFSSESNWPQNTLMSKRFAEEADLPGTTNAKSENFVRDAAASAPSRVSQDYDAGKHVELQDTEAAVLKFNNNDEDKQFSVTAENGFGSATGLAEGQDIADEAQPAEEENGDLIASSQGEGDIHIKENLNSQATDIATATVVNGSQNSSSMQEDLSQDFSEPVAKTGPATKVKDKPKERKPRSRGRGK